MRAGAGISTALDPVTATQAAVRSAGESCGSGEIDFALVLVSAAHGTGIRRVAEHAAASLGTDALLGVSVEGVIGAGVEVADNPAVAVLALQGCDVHPFQLDDLGSDAAGAGPELATWIGAPLSPDDLVVLLPDPLRVLPQRLLPALEAHLAPARVVGGASGCVGGGGAIAWLGDESPRRTALSGFVLRGTSAQVAVTQATRAVTQPLEVTRARGNWILSIDGRPALDVYREAARGPLGEDLQRAARFLLVAIAARARCGSVRQSDFQVRHVVGIDEARSAISLPQPVPSGSTVWLSMLDADAARTDLRSTLETAREDPLFGLYFNCRARGESLFGVSGLEAGYLERRYGGTPIIGTSGAFQIAPATAPEASSAQVLTYAGVLTLFGR